MGKRKTFIITSALALLPALFILFAYFILPEYLNRTETLIEGEHREVAEILKQEGQVYWRTQKDQKLLPLPKTKEYFHHHDRVQTAKDATLTLQFNSGYIIKILPESHILLELWEPNNTNSPIYINFISGNYSVIEQGQSQQLFVLKNQNLHTPESKPTQDVMAININNENIQNKISIIEKIEETSPIPTDDPSETKEKMNSLSNELIRATLSKQSPSFQRCQLNALRSQKQSSGKILIGFTILPKGKTKDIKVLNSTLDRNFNNCIVSVFSRTRFQSFSGPSIVLSYPVVFE